MRLHTLTFSAIGPFAGEHTIDFDELGASGLFLLEGPTGAGKSTLIDAIVFALYGQVAGAGASSDRVRSRFADSRTESIVDLVFETTSGLFRVRRTPAYQRAKERGTGTTTQNVTAKMWRLASLDDSNGGEPIALRADEVGREVQRAIGLTREQFVQTIVLPQGEFASFLRAKPEERRALLQDVFGTGVYESLGAELARMRREADDSIALAGADVAAATGQLVGAVGEVALGEVLGALGKRQGGSPTGGDVPPGDVLSGDVPPGDLSESDPAFAVAELRRLASQCDPALLGLARAAAASLRSAAQTTADADAAARALLTAARTRADRAAELTKLFRARAELRAEVEVLDAGRSRWELDRSRRDAARRAAAVHPVLEGLARADEALAVAELAVAAARREAPVDLRDLDVSALATLREKSKEEAASLGWALDLAAEVEQRSARLGGLRVSLADVRSRLSALDLELAGRPAERGRVAVALAGATSEAVELTALTERAKRAQSVLQAASTAARTAAKLVEASAARALEATVATAAVDAEHRLRSARIAGIAGELAAVLVPGESCPVCGATEHPRPAGRGPHDVGAAEVAAAEDVRSRAERGLELVSTRVVALTERLAAQQDAAEGLSVTAAHEAAALADAAVHAATQAAIRGEAFAAQLASFDTETETLSAQRGELGTTLIRLETDELAVAGALVADSQRLEEAGAGFPTVAARRAALGAAARAADSLRASIEAHTAAEHERHARALEAAATATVQGFDSPDAAAAAHLDPAAIAALDSAVTRHESAVARVAVALAAPEIAGLPDDAEGDPAADVVAARASLGEAELAGALAARVAATAADRAGSSHEARARIDAAWARREAAREAAAPVLRMAELANGLGSDNPERLTLATFVLLRRFEDVVAAANDRLRTMSSGRYELARKDGREDRGGLKQGLALTVRDHVAGAERDPRTLSGGETFYVSLCLALGMADVVTSEAGGMDLGTLFVDEGFGSLDAEVLEEVLGVLGRLSANGRVVGVVSHVEELKKAIAERVEVRRLPDGSSTLHVNA